jgi:glutamyl-tRNA synthetase
MVRTRFAPSPTGYLHIGGVRTALFNWLFARRHQGRFILRIDDTDQERHREEALQPILEGFRWLKIDWDEGPEVGGKCGPYFQSERSGRYRAAVQTLLEQGLAYTDYATPPEIQAEREAATAEKRSFLYSRRWMAETPGERARFEAEGRRGIVRLKMPREGMCGFTDLIRGEMSFEWAREQDHVIQRADGSCLYHLANVVDDEEMGISHVIRAEEHLSNTPRQIFIARGLGYELPAYGHVPFVAEPGSRSKPKLEQHGRAIASAIGLDDAPDRFNPVIVDFYEKVGYLPDAVVNYLLLLGWSLDDKTEFFSREEMIRHFSLERVNKAPASFDPDKLVAFQEHYMQSVGAEEKLALVVPYLQRAQLVPTPAGEEVLAKVTQVVEAAGSRIRVAGDILDYAGFFVLDDELPYDEKAFEKRIQRPPEAVGLLAKFRERLATAEPFEPNALEGVLASFVESEGIKIGQIIHSLRVAVTGKGVGFGMFEGLGILGRERCLHRIDRALRRAGA